MVTRVLGRPGLHEAFATVKSALGTLAESSEVQRLYMRLAPANFSEAVLASRPANPAVLPVAGVHWSDWGQPERVMATLGSLGL
jgi:hypothetical protein